MFALVGTAVHAQSDQPLYKQSGSAVEKRVEDLLARMTLEEKVAQLVSIWTVPIGPSAAGLVKPDGTLDEAIARQALGKGVGSIDLTELAGPGGDGRATASIQNKIQSWLLDNTRLGIPVLFRAEALHGATVNGSTSFPQSIGLGSTWNTALVRQVFAVVAQESRAAGITMALAPVLDLAREPRFGRTPESFSEDPFLTGELGLAAVQGLQGSGPGIDQNHVIAVAKHFVTGQPEGGTHVGPSDYSERTMRSVFMPPFEKAIEIGQMGALMISHNETMGGIPSHANPWLLQEVLRREWAFTGLTVSDYYDVPLLSPMLPNSYAVAPNPAAAGVLAFNSGVDMELPTPIGFPALVAGAKSGLVDQQALDAAVGRVLTAKFRTGLFDRSVVDAKRALAVIGTKASGKLARQVADQTMVLLKNENDLLPLDPAGIRTLAVIGPNADKMRLGGYSGNPPYFVSVLDGVRQRVGAKVKVSYAEGNRITEPDASPELNKMAPYRAPSAESDAQLLEQAVETAKAADVIVLVLGDNETVTRESHGKLMGPDPIWGDTDTLRLPGKQNELVSELVKLGKPIVAVLLNGRPYAIETLSNSVPAILEGWYLGQETGNAIAGVLFGDVNPSGRLPVTIARNVGQLPVYYYHSPRARPDYIFADSKPLYPFGYGLSYTSFSYGKPTLDQTSISVSGMAKVSITVTNTGTRAGDEVVQMYIHPKVSSVVQPVMRLAGFQRVHLTPGQSAAVTFNVGAEQLAIWNAQMKRVVEPGPVEVMIGRNVADTTTIVLDVQP